MESIYSQQIFYKNLYYQRFIADYIINNDLFNILNTNKTNPITHHKKIEFKISFINQNKFYKSIF